jgi:hypothetical protein
MSFYDVVIGRGRLVELQSRYPYMYSYDLIDHQLHISGSRARLDVAGGVSSINSSLARKRASIAWLDGDVHEYAVSEEAEVGSGTERGRAQVQIESRLEVYVLIDRIKQLGDR